MTVTTPRRSRLAWRVYGFTAAMALVIMTALLVLPRYTRSARYLEPQAALVQYLVERWSLKDPQQFATALARVEPRLRGKLSLFAADGTLLRSNKQPPLAPPSAAERTELLHSKWVLEWGRIVVRSDDGSMIGVYAPNRPGFPWSWVLPLGAIILVIVGAASLWFARRLAVPLDRLADAARRFGAGDVRARAALARHDELGEVGRAFDDMAERTAAVMHSQRQLMADVSHELRTPLARIRVALELAAEDPVAAKDVLVDVSGDLDEIDQLIEDILTTARLDGEAPTLRRTPTRLGDLIGGALTRFAARHGRRVLERTSDPDVEDRVVDCDPRLLRRALDNLLDNAAKYSASVVSGEPSPPVRLAIHQRGTATGDAGDKPAVVFEIIDRGIGLSATDLERAFTPFWRADTSRTRRTGGVGLGLALARRIARAHGGDVTLRSTPGEGTTARLEVPLAG